MPIYTYKCKECNHSQKELMTVATESVPCEECHKGSTLQMPTGSLTMNLETKDQHRNVKQRKGQDKQLKERMRNHHDNYELQEKIDKFGVNDAKRHGWLRSIKKL